MQHRIQQDVKVQKNRCLYFVAHRAMAEQLSSIWIFFLWYYCPLYRIEGANAAFEQATKLGAFLNSILFSWSAGISMCHWAGFTYLVFWRDENIDGVPVSLVHIHSASAFAVSR